MKGTFTSVFIFIILLLGSGCQKKAADKAILANPDIMHTSVRKLTDVMVHDIFSPPVASRIYAYANIAAYEALVPGYPGYQSLAGQLTNLKNLPKPTLGQEYCYPLASLRAFLTVGRTLTFSGDKIDEFEPQVYQKYKDSGLDEEVYNRGNRVLKLRRPQY